MLKRAAIVLTAVLFLTFFIPQVSRAEGQSYPIDDGYYFAETGHTVKHGFWSYFRTHGRLRLLGYPISEELVENGITVQYFQRARLEYHADLPEHHKVILGLLGTEIAEKREKGPAFSPVPPVDNSLDRMYFPETGHTLSFGFRQYWRKHNGLTQFGLAISEEFQEVSPTDGKPYTVQYFERARFEYHPELPEGSRIVLGLLGQEFVAARGWSSQDYPLAPVSPPPAVTPRTPNIWGPELALTFDDAFPSPQRLYDMLATLRRYDVKCTFFLRGDWIRQYPNLVDFILSEGHEIGNHTYGHADLVRLGDDQVRDQIRSADGAVLSATGVSTKPLFRFPYGNQTAHARDIVASEGYTVVGWNIDPADWKGTSASELIRHITSRAFDGGIVVLHPTGSGTAAALEPVIQNLQARGFQLETIGQMWNLP